jgi:predicted RNA binding protein YcfA (HicA-like mRNA interferase family)
MHSKKVIERLLQDGWSLRGVRGSHHVYVHPTKNGHIVVTHPRKDMPIGLLKAVFKQAGLTGEVK